MILAVLIGRWDHGLDSECDGSAQCTIPGNVVIHQSHSVANLSKVRAVDINSTAPPHSICNMCGVKESLDVAVI